MKAIAILAVVLLSCGCITQNQDFNQCPISVASAVSKDTRPIVALGVQVAAKPVGLDILNPATSASAQNNNGTTESSNKSGDVKQDRTKEGK
jgi:hypothetical protein